MRAALRDKLRPSAPIGLGAGRAGRARRRGTEGVAFLLVVVVIALVMAVLAATLFRVALDNQTTSARIVQQNQALQAAESGIDLAYQSIEQITLASSTVTRHKLPCGPLSGTLGSGPSPSSYTVSVHYYKYTTATNPTPTQLSLGTCATSPIQMVRIVLTATGQDLVQTAKVTSQAYIAPVNPLANSVFVNGSLTLRGSNSSIGGQSVYIHTGNLTCNGGGTIMGSVTVFGKVTASGSCSVAGALEATTSISIAGSTVIGGTVISTTGSITVTGTAPTVSGSMYAHGSITISSTKWKTNYLATHTVTGTKVNYTVNPTETALVRPTKQTWPTIKWTSFTWTSLKYTTYTARTSKPCTAVKTDVLLAKSAAATGKVGIAINTTCQVTFKAITATLKLAQDLAIVSTAGITVTKNASITDSSSTRRTIFLVVPTGTACTGTKGNITIHGTIGTNLATLLYSPCTVNVQGSSPIKEGKIYAKNLTLNGNMTLGTANFTFLTSKATQVSVGVAYERQVH